MRKPNPRAAALLAILLLTACTESRTESRARWRLSSPPESTALHIRVERGSSTCHEIKGVKTVESAATVDVRVSISSKRAYCTLEMVYEQLTITLKAPLQGRRLVGCEPGPAGPATDCLEVSPRP